MITLLTSIVDSVLSYSIPLTSIHNYSKWTDWSSPLASALKFLCLLPPSATLVDHIGNLLEKMGRKAFKVRKNFTSKLKFFVKIGNWRVLVVHLKILAGYSLLSAYVFHQCLSQRVLAQRWFLTHDRNQCIAKKPPGVLLIQPALHKRQGSILQQSETLLHKSM